MSDEIGGHLLSGHISGLASVVSRDEGETHLSLGLRIEPALVPYVPPKGYIGLDGCSLTVGETVNAHGEFSVHLIPETLRVTTLGTLRPGDQMNVELDAMTRAVVDTSGSWHAEAIEGDRTLLSRLLLLCAGCQPQGEPLPLSMSAGDRAEVPSGALPTDGPKGPWCSSCRGTPRAQMRWAATKRSPLGLDLTPSSVLRREPRPQMRWLPVASARALHTPPRP